jgi:hypothetical protein
MLVKKLQFGVGIILHNEWAKYRFLNDYENISGCEELLKPIKEMREAKMLTLF